MNNSRHPFEGPGFPGSLESLCSEIQSAIRNGFPINREMAELVTLLRARATGCWRLKNSALELMGFGAADDMPQETIDGFRAATERVGLDKVDLGIVKAAVTNGPAIASISPADGTLMGSANWIARFGARSSLAIPIRGASRCLPSSSQVETVPADRRVVGVLAVSTFDLVDHEPQIRDRLEAVASAIAEVLETRERRMN